MSGDLPKVPTLEAEQAELAELALEIADESARCDLESFCDRHSEGGVVYCFVPPTDPEEAQWVERAVRYLALRGQLVRHPEQWHLVRVTS